MSGHGRVRRRPHPPRRIRPDRYRGSSTRANHRATREVEGEEQRVEIIGFEERSFRRCQITALRDIILRGRVLPPACGDAAEEGEVSPFRGQSDTDDGDLGAAELIGDSGRAADVLLPGGDRRTGTRFVSELDPRGVGLRLPVL